MGVLGNKMRCSFVVVNFVVDITEVVVVMVVKDPQRKMVVVVTVVAQRQIRAGTRSRLRERRGQVAKEGLYFPPEGRPARSAWAGAPGGRRAEASPPRPR